MKDILRALWKSYATRDNVKNVIMAAIIVLLLVRMCACTSVPTRTVDSTSVQVQLHKAVDALKRETPGAVDTARTALNTAAALLKDRDYQVNSLQTRLEETTAALEKMKQEHGFFASFKSTWRWLGICAVCFLTGTFFGRFILSVLWGAFKRTAGLPVLLFFPLVLCGRLELPESAHDKRQEKIKQASTALSAVYWGSYDHEECLVYEGGVNPLYFGGGYFLRYVSDWNAYNTGIILGDSTMDLAVNAFTGYVRASGVGAYPVSGNKTCDMNVQLLNVHAVNPAFVWISTAGGNDILAQLPDSDINRSNRALLDKVRSRWPSARICLILVHPTQVAYANQHKAAVNSAAASYAAGMGNAFSYNPLPLFGVAEGQAAPSSMLLDSIHPDENTAKLIRDAGQAACGIYF